MLLRSSSTPVVGTLFSSLSDSPNKEFDTINNRPKHPLFHDHSITKLSFSHFGQHHNLSSFSCNSSPTSHSTSGFFESNQETNIHKLKAFRRAQSDGNLEGLAYSNCDFNELRNSSTPTKSSYKAHKSMLQTIPSFSIHNSKDEPEGEEEHKQEDKDREALGKSNGYLERSVTIGDSIEARGSAEFSIGKNGMELIKEDGEEEEVLSGFQNLGIEENGEPISPPLYLATGLGIEGAGFDGIGSGGGAAAAEFIPVNLNESGDVEEYYRKMVDEYPCHPLFLRNYAQLLQSKGELQGAEDYYYRATLADPEDGEIMLQYAKLVWEVHRDQNRALSYFERAAQAAPEDTHVLAAYASFLWEIGDEKEKVEEGEGMIIHKSAYEKREESVNPSLHPTTGLGIDVADYGSSISSVDFSAENSGQDGSVEVYYKRMIEENPCNPLFLRNYAQFLYQSKGDLQGAEEYYLRAILADPGDGEIMSQYAKLVWELHHDKDAALSYFEKAVQANPGDCHVLAAYASFLWETEEEEEEHSARQDNIQVPIFEGAIASTNA